MYLFETGFGQISKAPAKWPFKKGVVMKDGHRRICGDFGDGTGFCQIMLKVKFRRSFEDFLREVENAIGRLVERSTARMLIKQKHILNDLKVCHHKMLNEEVLDSDLIIVKGGINYSRSKGPWLVVNSSMNECWRLIDL